VRALQAGPYLQKRQLRVRKPHERSRGFLNHYPRRLEQLFAED